MFKTGTTLRAKRTARYAITNRDVLVKAVGKELYPFNGTHGLTDLRVEVLTGTWKGHEYSVRADQFRRLNGRGK